MTLYRQLLVTVSVIFAMLLIVVYIVEFTSTRDSLAEQQSTMVINTATSLGLAVTPYLDSGDTVGAESVIKAVFDGGFYRQISLDLFATKQQIMSQNSTEIQGVPDWFISLNIFSNATHQQVLTSGWLQLGKIKVEGHSGYAYRQLWMAMSDLLTLFLVGYLVVLIVLIRALSFLLRPLQQIKQQAIEIQHRHFSHPIPLPSTLELKELVGAINHMSAKLAQQFKEQAAEAEALRRQAYQDHVSGLGNRAYFVSQVNSWIAEGGRGGVVLLAVDILEKIYNDEGFEARDELVLTVANKLKESMAFLEQSALSRITATEFALLLPGIEGEELRTIGNNIQQLISGLVVNPMGSVPKVCAVGLAQRTENEAVGELLTLADSALQTARAQLVDEAVLSVVSSDTKVMGRMGWKALVNSAIENHLMRFKVQPVTLLEHNKAIHVELFSSIRKDDTEYHAGQFLPAIEQYDLGTVFDRYVLTKIIELLPAQDLSNIAVNLTTSALKQKDFRAWLTEYMVKNSAFASRIAFEIPEAVLVNCDEPIEHLCQTMHQQGFSFGVDQYGRNIQSLDYLARLRPDYVKIDFGYTAQVLQEEGDTQFLMAICRVARNLKITTIAQRIETAEQIEALTALKIDGYQGYIHPPFHLE